MSDDPYKETWFIVPSYILDLPGLTLRSLRVYETIYQFWNKSRKCFLSNPEIERRTGVKVTQVKEAIAFFEKYGELERIQIGMKRYLIQPIKAVEIPGLELVPKQVALNQATCTTVAQVALNQATGGLKSGHQVALNQATEIKNLNKEKKRSNTKVNLFLEEALKDNPHNLTREILEEWDEIRIRKHKSPLTARAWKRTNNVLTLLTTKGLKLSEIIDRMLASEWRGVEVSYFEKELQAVNKTPVIRSVDDAQLREQLKQQAIAREEKERVAKEQERRDAPNIMKNLKVSMAERMAQQEAEMKRLGMNHHEYHAHLTKNKNTVPEDNI